MPPASLLYLLACFLLTACQPIAQGPVVSDREILQRALVNFKGELSLQQAISLALQHNLDYVVKVREQEILREAATAERLRLLPSVIAKGEITSRDRPLAATDMDFETGARTKQATVASDETRRTWSLAGVWNLLDFSIAYFHSRAAVCQSQANAERLRRSRQNLALDVTRAWWRAQCAQTALAEAERLMAQLDAQQETIRRQVEAREVPEIEAREMEVTLTLLRMRLQDLRHEARQSRTELVFLLGLAPNAEFTLPPPAMDEISAFSGAMDEWEEEALRQRPEMAANASEEMVHAYEVRAQMAGLLPAPTLWLSREGDSNSFLVYHQWVNAGLQTAWDLLSLPRRQALLRQARARREHVRAQRLAVASGILAQVHMANFEVENAREQYRLARQLHEAREKQLAAVQRHLASGESRQHIALRLEAETFLARMRMLTAYADLHVAEARFYNSLGREPEAAAGATKEANIPSAIKPEDFSAPLPEPLLPQNTADQ